MDGFRLERLAALHPVKYHLTICLCEKNFRNSQNSVKQRRVKYLVLTVWQRPLRGRCQLFRSSFSAIGPIYLIGFGGGAGGPR